MCEESECSERKRASMRACLLACLSARSESKSLGGGGGADAFVWQKERMWLSLGAEEGRVDGAVGINDVEWNECPDRTVCCDGNE